MTQSQKPNQKLVSHDGLINKGLPSGQLGQPPTRAKSYNVMGDRGSHAMSVVLLSGILTRMLWDFN